MLLESRVLHRWFLATKVFDLCVAVFLIALTRERLCRIDLILLDPAAQDVGINTQLVRDLSTSPAAYYDLLMADSLNSRVKRRRLPRLLMPHLQSDHIRLNWGGVKSGEDHIDESLRKWTGVTLYYDNAWRDHAEKAWVTEHFHVIDRATLLDRERRSRRLRQAPEDPTAGKSSIVWNELVFNSFEAGYIKKLDFAFLQSLRKPTSKRLYRFLGKRFYFGDTCNFELRNLACEHMGLSKSHSNSKLKERLGPAIDELTSRGFLAPLHAATQFKRVRRGEWRVYFAKRAKQKRTPKAWERGSSRENRRQRGNTPEPVIPPAARVYLESLSSEERARLEREAISAATEGEKTVLQSLTNTEGPAYQAALGRMVARHLRSHPAIKAA